MRNRVYKFLKKLYRITRKKFRTIGIKFTARKMMKTLKTEPNKIAIATNTYTYTCNPKYIYEELVRRNLNYKIVWLSDRKPKENSDYPKNLKVVSLYTREGIGEVYRSKVWIDNGIVFSNYFDKRKDQIHIQTMHGSLGIKKLDNAVLSRNARGKKGRRIVRRESEETDYVITNSQFEEDVFHTVFWKNTPMVRLGHARTDLLFSTNETKAVEIRDRLFHLYGIPREKKLVLYAPTHRVGLTIDDLHIDFPDMTRALGRKFGGTFAVMFRTHHKTRNIVLEEAANDIMQEQLLYNVHDYPDIQELMLVTDVGITDYSSWIFDYVLTRRPGFIFAIDLERYNTNTGLYYPLEETPFPVCRSQKQLIDSIEAFDKENYIKRVDIFLKNKQSVDDGSSSRRIVDWLQELVPSTERSCL